MRRQQKTLADRQAKPLIDKVRGGQRLDEGQAARLLKREQSYESALTKFLGALQKTERTASRIEPRAERKGFVKRALDIAKPVTQLGDQHCSLLRGAAWLPFVPQPWKSRLSKGVALCKRLSSAIAAVKQTLD